MARMRNVITVVGGVAVLGLLAAGSAVARGPGGGPPSWAGLEGGPMMLLEEFDANDDGRVTDEEVRAGRAERLRRFDANGDGVLALDEFQALWADAMRRAMVRSFQRLDTDGDGRVTGEEFELRYVRMVERLDRDGDGSISRDELRATTEGRHGPRGDRDRPHD